MWLNYLNLVFASISELYFEPYAVDQCCLSAVVRTYSASAVWQYQTIQQTGVWKVN